MVLVMSVTHVNNEQDPPMKVSKPCKPVLRAVSSNVERKFGIP